ncbi:MAG: hypothetical protein HKP61_16095 [Dactylosporangium sp.]|nr:hypothetical protein [Dactylosporangium sp.]NNJ62427.1 hypothetical protein [Dactylosporangium sp.]
MVRGNRNLQHVVGRHLEFAALTGNEARGLEILSGHAGWLLDEEHRDFLVGAVMMLRRLAAMGHHDVLLPVSGADTRTGSSGMTLEDVLAHLEDRFTTIIRRFDERNGSSVESDRIAALLVRDPYCRLDLD